MQACMQPGACIITSGMRKWLAHHADSHEDVVHVDALCGAQRCQLVADLVKDAGNIAKAIPAGSCFTPQTC